MNQNVLSAVIRRLRVIPAPEGSVNPGVKVAFCGQLAAMGYEVAGSEHYTDGVLSLYSTIEHTLLKLKGGHVKHVPLFEKFPEDIPTDDEVMARHIMMWFGSFLSLFSKGDDYDGVLVPEWMNDPMFGLSSIPQTHEHYVRGVQRQATLKGDTNVVLHPIELVPASELVPRIESYLRSVFYAKSSIKEAARPDIEAMLQFVGPGFLDAGQVTFKETLAYLMKFYWQQEDFKAVQDLTGSATDVLRMLAALTDTDVSLATTIKFPKMSKPKRRAVLAAIESTKNITASLFQYRNLWLKVGRSLHVGQYSDRFPETYQAFYTLRNGEYKTWDSQVEMAFRGVKKDTGRKVLQLLGQRPGQFARKLHRAVRVIGDPAIDAFLDVSTHVPLKTLLILERYFATVDAKTTRSFYTKKGRMKVIKNELTALTGTQRDTLMVIMRSAIRAKISASDREMWAGKKVWVDQTLEHYVAPLAQRKASDSLITAGRGTRLPVDLSKAIRVFVYWKEIAGTTTDLDLSAVTFDEKFGYLSHVSYTRLSGNGMTHSGDLVSAPHGAAEFIDMDVQALKATGARYVAPQIYRYSGSNFGECAECFSGWMSRSKCSSAYRTFDVKTVENAFAMQGQARFSIPFLIDLETGHVIYVDLYVGNQPGTRNRVENSLGEVSTLLNEVVMMGTTKPNLFDLAMHHVSGRGADRVENSEDADIRIGIRGCDFNALDTEVVLSEFL